MNPDDPGQLLAATVRIKREVKMEEEAIGQRGAGATTDDDDDEDDAAIDEEEEAAGCSRTLPRMPQAWRQQQQRDQVQVIQPSAPAASAAAPPTTRPTVDVKPPVKAVIHPHPQPSRKSTSPSASNTPPQSSSSASIPVGIAVARQRAADKPRRSSTPLDLHNGKRSIKTPRPSCHHPPAPIQPVPTPDLFMASSPLPPPLPLPPPAGMNPFFNSSALGFGSSPAGVPPPPGPTNWSWPSPAVSLEAMHYHHSFWPAGPPHPDHHVNTAASMMGYPGTYGHHHHTATGLTPPPFLLIPAACLGKLFFFCPSLYLPPSY